MCEAALRQSRALYPPKFVSKSGEMLLRAASRRPQDSLSTVPACMCPVQTCMADGRQNAQSDSQLMRSLDVPVGA